MENTGRFDLPLIMPQQAQKHITHNEALTLIDGLMHLAIKSFGESNPPPSAQIDDAFVVGASPSGLWFGEAGNIAFNTSSGWRFVSPRQGMVARDLSTGSMVLFDQTLWTPLGDTLEISTLPTLGINTTADAANRIAVRSNAALLTAINAGDGGNGDMRVKLNKEATADTTSLLYQTGFSGRAEIGLAGNDDLSIKVSPDGSAWVEGLSINRTTGQVTLHDNSVGNAAMADMPTARLKGRATAGIGAPEDLTATQATALLNSFSSTLKGLTPASGGGTANFLRADGTWAAPAGGGTVDPLDLTVSVPGTPAANTLRVFRRDHGGRQMLASIGPSGADTTYQPFMATNKIARWNPAGNATTVPIVDGFTAAFTALGTATARNVATTNFNTRLRRFGYVSAATAAALCGHYSTVAQWTIGTGTGLGGFHYVCRFVPSDAANVSGARMFVGMRNAVTAPTNVEPSTGQTNFVGVVQLSTSANLQIVYGGSAAQTPIDLGASFPANGASIASYELQLFASPTAQTISYKVTRLDTGVTASGTLSGVVGTAIPAATTFLAHTAWRTNNATLLACGLDIVGVYLETDS